LDAALNSMVAGITSSSLYTGATVDSDVLTLAEATDNPDSEDVTVNLAKLITTTPNSISSTDISTFENAITSMERVYTGIYQIDLRRANLGAAMNRLEFASDNMSNIITNAQTSRSRIADADYAEEATELARIQIIQQAAIAMLAQANLEAKQVLTLLE
tara:strand:- start:470 stop:946 length:477 start_codon:yes stop_codon:yes gene_type:complete